MHQLYTLFNHKHQEASHDVRAREVIKINGGGKEFSFCPFRDGIQFTEKCCSKYKADIQFGFC